MILNVPTDEELAAWIRSESAERWPDRPQWAISYRHYKGNHPEGWCGIVRLLSAHGWTDRTAHWRQLVHLLTGLRVPTTNEWLAYYRETGRGNFAGKRGPYNTRPVVLDRADMQPVQNASARRPDRAHGHDGLTVKARTCNVLRWDWRRHRYAVAGTEVRLAVV